MILRKFCKCFYASIIWKRCKRMLIVTHVVFKYDEEKTEIINYLYTMTAYPVSCGESIA